MSQVKAAVWIMAIEMFLTALIMSYLSLKFWSLRRHFIIASRFPKFTLVSTMAIFVVTLLISIPEFIEVVLDNHDAVANIIYLINVSYGSVLFFIFFTMIILRTYLVYRKGKISQHKLQIKTSILLNALNVDDYGDGDGDGDTSSYYHVQSTTPCQKVVISISATIAIIIQLTCATLHVVTGWECPRCQLVRILLWIILSIIGVFTLIVTRNTKESLSCRKETVVSVIVILSTLLGIYGGRQVGIPYEWRRFISNTLTYFNFCTFLVVPLRLLYKVEGSISLKKIVMRQSSEDYSNQDLIDHLKSEKSFHSFADFLVC